MSPLAQNPSFKLKKNFFPNYTTPLVISGFEHLSSSICCRVMADQSLAWKGKLCLFWITAISEKSRCSDEIWLQTTGCASRDLFENVNYTPAGLVRWSVFFTKCFKLLYRFFTLTAKFWNDFVCQQIWAHIRISYENFCRCFSSLLW